MDLTNKKSKKMNKKIRKVGQPVKLVICGSREFNDYKLMRDKLDELLKDVKIQHICQGGCRGTDYMAIKYAHERGYNVMTMRADWKRHGKAAGPMRNRNMALHNNATIAFLKDNSKGTLDMIRQAAEHEHEFIHVENV